MAKSKITSSLENTVSQPSDVPKEDAVDNYQVKEHLRTLQEAHGIINDHEKMSKVHKLAGRHAKALAGIKNIQHGEPKMKSLDDLKKYRNDKFGAKASSKKSLDALKDTDQDGE